MDIRPNGAAVVSAPAVVSGVEEEQAAAQCLNCAAPVASAFCPDCGEEHDRNQILPLGVLLRRGWREFVGFDVRLVSTLRLLLFKPGAATKEYAAGRRRQYARPWRLYLTLSALYFLIVALYQPHNMDVAAQFGAQGVSDVMTFFGATIPEALFLERTGWYFNQALSLSFTVNIPILALVLKLFYPKAYLHEHVLFALHYMLFAMIVAVVLMPLDQVGVAAQMIVMLALTWPYLFVALRRMYGETRLRTAWKFVPLVAIDFVTSQLLVLAAMGYAFMRAAW